MNWQPSKRLNNGDLVRFDGIEYVVSVAGITGDRPPLIGATFVTSGSALLELAEHPDDCDCDSCEDAEYEDEDDEPDEDEETLPWRPICILPQFPESRRQFVMRRNTGPAVGIFSHANRTWQRNSDPVQWADITAGYTEFLEITRGE